MQTLDEKQSRDGQLDYRPDHYAGCDHSPDVLALFLRAAVGRDARQARGRLV